MANSIPDNSFAISPSAPLINPPVGLKSILSLWPVDRPRDWTRWLNEPQTDLEMNELEECPKRHRPIGDAACVQKTAARLSLEQTLRQRGRPAKDGKELRPL
jgi:hypothetical protein